MKWFLIFCLLLNGYAFAQSNYKAGYVIENNGDTLKGLINYREWNLPPTFVEFKSNLQDKKEVKFNARDIKKFQVKGIDSYISYKGLISTNIITLPDLPVRLDTGKKQDTVFLQQLTTGKNLTLYFHGDVLKIRFFVAEGNAKPVELTYYPYFESASQQVAVDRYKNQLIYYAGKFTPENHRLPGSISRIKYERGDITSMVNQINNYTAKEKSSFRFFAGLEINSTTTKTNNPLAVLNEDNADIRDVISSQTTILPKIDVGLDLFNNPNTQRIIFRGEASFSFINPSFTYPNPTNPNQDVVEKYQIDHYSINQYTISIAPQIIFNVYNKENVKVFFGLGASINYSFYSDNNKFIHQDNSTNIPTTEVVSDPFTFQSVWGTLPFRAGVTINKKIELSFSFAKAVYFGSSNSYFDASNQSVSLGVKYLFNRD